MSYPTPALSSEAQLLQQQFMGDPTLLQRFYQAYNNGQLPQPQLDAFKQLLAAASRQQQQAQGASIEASGSQAGQAGPPPPASQQFAAVAQASQVPQTGSPGPQQIQNAIANNPAAQKDLHDFREGQSRLKSFEGFLQRTDVPADKRQQAEAEMAKTRQHIKTIQARLVVAMQSNGTLPTNMPPAGAAGQVAGAAHTDMQAQQARAMAARQQAIISQQRQQTTGSPVVPQQSLPNPAQQAAGIVRAPSQATTGSPATETKSLPPAAKRARVDGPGQPPLQQGQGGPPRPGSVAQQQVAAYNPVGGPAAIADDIASRVPSAGKPEPFPHARPTLSQGLAAQPIVSTPGVTYRPAAGQQSAHPPLTPAQLAAQERLDAARVVPRSSLREILQSICPGANMDDEVEDFVLDIADEFIETVTKHSCALAVHRKSDRLEVKDVQLHLDRAWDIQVPGFAMEEVRQTQGRRLNPPASQLARLAAVREASRRRT